VEGLNPHLIILDEMHVWRDKQFYNALMYGDCIRSQPMFLMITTAGDDATTIGFEEYEFAKELLDPANDFYSQNHFAYIAEAEDKDDWTNPESWLQANPSLRGDADDLRPRDDDDLPAETRAIGRLDKLATLANEAKATPRKQRQFIRYICNRWVTESEDTWLDPDEWAKCGGMIPDHSGEPAWGGLDLSQTRDTSALCLALWNKETPGTLDLVWKFWIPADNML
jgi:phage terminase large subunit-like protein